MLDVCIYYGTNPLRDKIEIYILDLNSFNKECLDDSGEIKEEYSDNPNLIIEDIDNLGYCNSLEEFSNFMLKNNFKIVIEKHFLLDY